MRSVSEPLLMTSSLSVWDLAVPRASDLIRSHYCTAQLTEAHIQLPRRASETAWPAGLKIASLLYGAVPHVPLRGLCSVTMLICLMTIYFLHPTQNLPSLHAFQKWHFLKLCLLVAQTELFPLIKDVVIGALGRNCEIYSVTNVKMEAGYVCLCTPQQCVFVWLCAYVHTHTSIWTCHK